MLFDLQLQHQLTYVKLQLRYKNLYFILLCVDSFLFTIIQLLIVYKPNNGSRILFEIWPSNTRTDKTSWGFQGKHWSVCLGCDSHFDERTQCEVSGRKSQSWSNFLLPFSAGRPGWWMRRNRASQSESPLSVTTVRSEVTLSDSPCRRTFTVAADSPLSLSLNFSPWRHSDDITVNQHEQPHWRLLGFYYAIRKCPQRLRNCHQAYCRYHETGCLSGAFRVRLLWINTDTHWLAPCFLFFCQVWLINKMAAYKQTK